MQDKDKKTDKPEADDIKPDDDAPGSVKPDTDDETPAEPSDIQVDGDDVVDPETMTDVTDVAEETDGKADEATDDAQPTDETAPTDEAINSDAEPSAPEPTPEHKRGSSFGGILGIIVLVVIVAGAVAWFGPRLFPNETATLSSDVEQKLADLEADIGNLGDLGDRVSKLENDVSSAVSSTDTSSDLTDQVSDLGDRVTKLETTASTASSTSSGTTSGTGDTPDISALEDQIKKLEASVAALSSASTSQGTGDDGALGQSVTALQQQVEATSQAVSDLKDQIAKLDTLSGDVTTLSGDVTSLTSQVNQLAGRSVDPKAAFVVAVGQLREAAMSSGVFDQQLSAASAVAPDDSDAKAALAKLEPLASSGVASLASLQADFGATADAVVAASNAGSGWVDQTLSSLEGLVSVRRVGSDVEGDTPEAVVARAEAALDAGDLSTAVNDVSSLTGDAATAAADWLSQARDRLDVDQALQTLSARASALVTGATESGS